MNWHILSVVWDLIRGAGGVAVISVAIYYGPKKVLETWDWYVYRFRDSAVFEVIDQAKVYEHVIQGRRYANVTGENLAYTVPEISRQLYRKEKSVVNSLRRLKRAKKAVETRDGWYSTDTAPKH